MNYTNLIAESTSNYVDIVLDIINNNVDNKIEIRKEVVDGFHHRLHKNIKVAQEWILFLYKQLYYQSI